MTAVPHSQPPQAIRKIAPAAVFPGNLTLDTASPKQPTYITWAQVPREPTSIEIDEILKTILARRMLNSWTGSLELLRSYVDWITDLPSEKFSLTEDIPVMYERGEGGEWVASFQEANIHVSGENQTDAFETLRNYINKTFDILLREEKNLAPVAEKQLSVLKSYIRTS